MSFHSQSCSLSSPPFLATLDCPPPPLSLSLSLASLIPGANMQQQPSIFEPLFSMQAPAYMELMQERHTQPFTSHASSVLQLPPHFCFTCKSTTAPPAISSTGVRSRASCCSSLIMANDLHANMSASNSGMIMRSGSCHESLSSDDGSVASKLLSSITKSISSPSLQLASSKEAARETPYQKSLKLKHMKLQHCAEALGMESSDSSYSSTCYDMNSHGFQQEKQALFSCPPPQPKATNQETYSLTSVKSASNLNSAPSSMRMISSHSPKYTRCTSFPPPLSHTLPASASSHSFSVSLRPCREDGRFILKEVMVPSRNYFHANRRDGRLTLHVVTREDNTDEENFAYSQSSHNNHGLMSSEASCELEANIEVKEGHSQKESMVSLTRRVSSTRRATHEEVGSDGNEVMCANRSHPFVENVSVIKATVDSVELVIDDFKELPLAAKIVTLKGVQGVAVPPHGDRNVNPAASNFLHLKRVQCIATHGRTGRRDDPQGDAKSNIFIALSMQTTSHSSFTLHKAQVLSSLHPSSYSMISAGSMSNSKQSTLTHLPPGKSLGIILPSSHHDNMSSFPQSKENFIWESNLMPCVAVRRGCGPAPKSVARGDDASAFAMEDMNIAKSLMRMVAELATVGVSTYDGNEWCSSTTSLPQGRRPSTSLFAGGGTSTVVGSDSEENNKLYSDQDMSSSIVEAFSALSSDILMRGGVTPGHVDEYRDSVDYGSIVDFHVGLSHHEEEKGSLWIEAAGKVPLTTSSSLYSPSASPPPPHIAAYLQSEEWLNTLHCKELSDRNHLGICFMKPHSCIATRS